MREVLKYGEHAGVITPLFRGMKGETFDYCRQHPEVLKYAREVYGTSDRTADLLPDRGNANCNSDSAPTGGTTTMLDQAGIQEIVAAIEQLDWVVFVKQQMMGQQPDAEGSGPPVGRGSGMELPTGAGQAEGRPPIQKYPQAGRQYGAAFPGAHSMSPPTMAKRSPSVVKPVKAASTAFARTGEKLRGELDALDPRDPERYALQERIAQTEAGEKEARRPIAEAARKLALARGLSYEAALSLVEAPA